MSVNVEMQDNMEAIGTDRTECILSETKEESTKPEEPAFKLTRKNFLLSYKLHYALKSVLIYPFEAESFGLPEFVKWASKAKEFTIKKTWKGNSVAMLTFATYVEADGAICELRLALGDQTEIRHTRSNHTNPEVEVDSLLNYAIHASLATRVIVLEGLPLDVTQEQISEFFPDARTVILVKHDPEVQGVALVEYATTDKASSVLEEHKFPEDDRSYIVVDGQRVVLSKYKSRLNQAERSMRKQPAVEDPRNNFEKVALEDEARLQKCRQLKAYMEERASCLDDLLLEPAGRVDKYVELSQNMSLLAAYLNWDASRREREKLSLPESDDMKTWKQLYKEEIEGGGYVHSVDRLTSNGDGVRSLLDINPFEVPGGAKRAMDMPQDAGGPAKRFMESAFPVDFASQPGGYSMIQGLRNISQALTTQLNRIDDTLQAYWASDSCTLYRSNYSRSPPASRTSSSRRPHAK